MDRRAMRGGSRGRRGADAIARALIVFAACVGVTAACSEDGDQVERDSLVDSFVTALEATVDVECACRQVSSQDCASAKQRLRQCVNDAIAMDPQAAKMFPRCAVQSIRDYNACLRARGSCGADGIQGVESCVTDIDTGDCELPEALASCFPDDTPAPSETPVTPAPPEGLCSDDCSFDGDSVAGDGDCDDGGPGADYEVCALGTDCTDCGPR